MPLKYKLDNGLGVLLWESRRSPVISAQVWVRNGSIDEKRGQEGLSHFLEHLVFKGSEKYGVGEIAQKVEGAGGELNAYTSFDQTVYYVNISSALGEVALDVLSQMVGAPLFDPEEVENERGVILEEIKRSDDSPSRQASRLLFETNYKKHPYRRPVLGYERVIENIPVPDIVEFYESRYTPQNMTLVITGDFRIPAMKSKVEHYFGGLKRRKATLRPKFEEPEQLRPRLEVRETSFQEDMVFTAWKIPGFRHKDTPALDVLGLVLGQGESSRLYQRVRLESSLVKSIGCSSYTPSDHGLFAISTNMIRSKMPEALHSILEVLEEFYAEGPTKKEVDKAVLQISSEEIYSFETAEGLANKAGMGQFYHRDPEYLKSYMQKIAGVTERDLIRVAKKYLIPEKMSVSALMGPGADAYRPVLKKYIKSYRKTYEALKLPPVAAEIAPARKVPVVKITSSKPQLQEYQLSNGIKLYHQNDTSLPIFSVKAGFRGGSYTESGLQGQSDMMSRLWASGGAEFSEKQISEAMDSTSSGLSSFGGRNTNGLTYGGLSGFFSRTLPYFMACLTEPTFPELLLERERFQLLEYLKSRADQPQHRAALAFHKLMFGDHPYGRDVVPSEESLQQMDAPALREFYQQIFSTSGMYVATAGRLNLDRLMAELEKIPAAYAKTAKVLGVTELQRDHLEFMEMDKEQTHLIFGFRGTKIMDEDRYALSVLQGVLSGQGGRLFIDLRDKNSLAYTVSPVRMEGVDAGYFGAYIACSPHKAEKALEMMKSQFERLCIERVSTAELERSKKYLMGRHDLDLQRTSAKTSSVLFNVVYGLSPREDQEFLRKVQAVSEEDILRLSQKLFTRHHVVSAVGRTAPW